MSGKGFEDLLNNSLLQMMKVADSWDLSGDAIVSDSIDLANADGVVIHINNGAAATAESSNHHLRLILQDSADDSSFSPVTDEDVVQFKIGNTITAMEDPTTGLLKALDAAADENKLYTVQYTGSKRYVRISLDENGSITTHELGISGQTFGLKRAGAGAVLGTS